MKVLLEKTELHILMFLFFFGTAISVSQTNNEILLQVLSKLESLEKVEYIRSSHKISKFTAINSKDTSTVFLILTAMIL